MEVSLHLEWMELFITYLFLTRAWSNYQAYKAASYLKSLLTHNAMTDSPNETLTRIYAHSLARRHNSPSERDHPDIVLDQEGVSEILSAFDLPVERGPEIIHALEQVQLRLNKGPTTSPPSNPSEQKTE